MEWKLIETAPKDGRVKWGYAVGCQFAMVWRSPEWFKHGELPMSIGHETGAWVAQGFGIAAFTGNGLVNIVRPTHWVPLLKPPICGDDRRKFDIFSCIPLTEELH